MAIVVILISCYISAQIFSDVTSLKIISFFGLSMDAGTLIYPITFTLRDLVHKYLGVKIARLVIIFAAFINLFMAGLFWIVSILPSDLNVGVQKEFSVVLSPVWRIVLASILAEVVSELVDTEVYKAYVKRMKKKFQWMRVLISNLISVPLDSVVFAFGAFFGVFPVPVVLSIILSNVILKIIVTIFSTPLIYLIKVDRND